MTIDPRWCQQLLDELTDYAVFFVDGAGTIRTWHPGVRRVFGYDALDFIGRPLDTLFAEADREPARRQLAEAAEGGRCGEDRCYVRKDGSRFLAFGVLTAVRGDDGLRGFALIVRDATASAASARMLERARRRADRASGESHEKDALMAVLAHELRGPLNAIRGWIQMALDGTLPPQRLELTLRRVIRSTDRMARLVDDLSDASRITSGALPLQLAAVDLASVVRDAAAELATTAEDKQVSMHIDATDRPIVCGDRSRLAQVAGNLLANAVKYTPPGGRVTAVIERDHDSALVEIVDTGRGIAPEDLPHVFERFRRSRDAERREPGLGLGLWITRELVTAHGGSVLVTSQGPGRGATVRLTLPLADGDRATAIDPATDGTGHSGDDAPTTPRGP